MATLEETIRSLGLSAARGIPQLATGFVDLAALPFTSTGMLKPEQAVGSTAYLTSKGLLPPEQQGLLNQTTELLSGAINPATATKAALAKGGLLMAAPIAYHGSPHVFDKFDISKVGSGEGAQAYGHGIYFAESPNVAKEYQEKLSSTGSAKNLVSQFGGIDEGIAEASKRIEHYKQLIASGGGGAMDRARSFLGISQKNLQDLQRMKQGLPENTGGFYKVDIPDTNAQTFLNWDKSLKEQPKEVQKLIKLQFKDQIDSAKNLAKKYGDTFDENSLTGSQIYTWFAEGKSPEMVSEYMNKNGIKGIKYLDEFSRGNFKAQTTYKGKPYGDVINFPTKKQLDDYISEKSKEGFGVKTFPQTSNYVVFDPSTVKILERNNQSVQGLLK